MKENRKKTIRISILILILLIGIGYAALKTTLKVDGTVNIDKATWDVHFENVEITEGSVTANPAPTSNNVDTTEINYTINFTKPGDFFEFTVDMVNKGTIDAMVNSVTNKAYNVTGTTEIETPTYLINAVNYDDDIEIAPNHLLEAGESEKIKVRIEFKKDISVSDLPSSGDTSIVFKFKGDYKQADENSNPRYKKYKSGDLVYFDPVSQDACNSDTFDLTKINNNESTCYKFNVISSEKEYVTIMLDHNILWTSPVLYNQTTAPDPTLQALADATSTWTKVEPLNYTYDVSGLSGSYGELNCVNGTCKISIDNTPRVTNLRARIITGEEIRQLTLDTGASDTSAAHDWSITSGANYTAFYFSNKKYTIGSNSTITNDGKTDLKWLVQNTSEDTDSEATDSVYTIAHYNGYWTLSPYVALSSNYAWRVRPQGDMYSDGSSNSGIRPVIRIPKSLLNSN